MNNSARTSLFLTFFAALFVVSVAFGQGRTTVPTGGNRPAVPLAVHCGNRGYQYVVDRWINFQPGNNAHWNVVLQWALRREFNINGLNRTEALEMVTMQAVVNGQTRYRRMQSDITNAPWLRNWWRNQGLRILTHTRTSGVAWQTVCAAQSRDIEPDYHRFRMTPEMRQNTRIMGVWIVMATVNPSRGRVSYDRREEMRYQNPAEAIRLANEVQYNAAPEGIIRHPLSVFLCTHHLIGCNGYRP